MKLIKLAILWIPAALLAQTPAAQKTVWHGVFTSEQAERGRLAYREHCSPCHGPALEGQMGARLNGEEFMERWREYDVHALYEFVSKSMPRKRDGSDHSPGSLGEKTYLDLIAHILRVNKFPEGKAELDVENMKSILIEGKEGPKPLPNGALVQVIGCMATGQPSGFALTSASEPARTSLAQNSTPAELEKAKTKGLGMLRFRLAGLDFLARTFNPAEHLGERLQVKGYLIRQPMAERIDITSIEMIPGSCGQMGK